MKLSLELLEDRLAPSATQLVFTTSAQTILAGQPSALITVQLQDQNHQPVQAGPGGVAISVSSSYYADTFLDAGGNPLPNPASPTLTIAQGSSSVSFKYVEDQVGTPMLTVAPVAASAGLTSATQQETIYADQVVTNSNDSGPGSLRDAFLHAAAGNTIAVAAGAYDIMLLSPLPPISVNLNIVGAFPRIDGSSLPAASQGLFDVLSGVTVTLANLEIYNAPGMGVSNSGNLTLNDMTFIFNRGGAIFNDGTLTVSNSSLTASTAGIDSEAGVVTISDTTIANNQGGAIVNNGTMTLTRDVVSGNNSSILNRGTLAVLSSGVAGNNGPGIDSEAGAVTISDSSIYRNSINSNDLRAQNGTSTGGIGIYGGTLAISNSTVTDNNAYYNPPPSGGSIYLASGGGIYLAGTSATIFDTIVSGDDVNAPNATDVVGAFTSLGHNWIGAADSQATGFVASDIVGTVASPKDPMVDTNGGNGGPTQAVVLLPGSPCIDAGDNANAPAFDQRGLPRIVNGTIDIGAYEFQIVLSPSTLAIAQVGAAYQQGISAAPNTLNYTFAVTAGALPAGLSLGTDGTLNGTPTAGGAFTFTVTATDSSPGSTYSGSQSYTLVVNPPVFTFTTPAGAPLNVAYSQQLTASGGTAPYSNFTVSAGQLPPGITLSAAGLLSGTPTQAGGFLFTVVVTDSSGGTGPFTTGQQLSIIVTPPGFSYDPSTATLTITGTAASNKFEYTQLSTEDVAGNVHTTSTYTLNGVALSLADSLLAHVNVTAQGNTNTAILVTSDTYTGNDGLPHETYEDVHLNGNYTVLDKYNASRDLPINVSLTGFLTIYAYVGHADTGALGGIPGGENIFVTAGSYSYVTGQGEYWEISGAGSIYGFSTSASDQAWQYDAAGSLDAFVASGNAYSYMSGSDTSGNTFFNEAVGFQITYGIATHGNAIAYMIDSPGNDVFAGYAPYSYMSGSDSSGSLFNVAEGFLLVYAESFVGGTDYAYNYDPNHNILGGNWILLT